MKWEDFQKKQGSIPPNRVLVNVECPKCSAKIYRRTDTVLACYPPKHSYICESCGWIGTA